MSSNTNLNISVYSIVPVPGVFGEKILELLVELRYYVLKVHQMSIPLLPLQASVKLFDWL